MRKLVIPKKSAMDRLFYQATTSRLILLGLVLLLGGCATPLPQNFDRPESHALEPDPGSRLGQMVEQTLATHEGESGLFTMGYKYMQYM